jgi:cytochrome P450
MTDHPTQQKDSQIDLFDPKVQENWYPTYRLLRDEFPVHRLPGSNTYIVTRYEDVLHVLRHQEIFPTGGRTVRSYEAQRVYSEKGWERFTPLSTNPPDHRRYRILVDHFFDPQGATQWQPYIERTIHDLIDSFIDASGENATTEIVNSFALPLPIKVITHILGFPDEDIPRLEAWSHAWVLPFSGPLSVDQEVWVAERVVEFQHYIDDVIEAKRVHPSDDVISHLCSAMFDGRPLSNHEIISIVDHLFIGGNETTTFAITSALWLLLREPDLYERVNAERSLVPQFVEEVLRLESPTQGLYRSVAVDTHIGDTPIPAGSIVHIRYAAANRDDRVFPDPDQLDLGRRNSRRHMAFSLGEHHCPGSGLSRLEQNLALEALLDRLPNLRLVPGSNDFRHQPGFVLRALEALHVQWD